MHRTRAVGWWKGGWSLVLLLGSVNAACSGYRPPRTIDIRPTMDPHAIEGTPLEEIWSRRAGRGLGGAVAQSDTVVYFGAADRHIIAVDLRNGAQRWTTRVMGPLAEGVAADDRRVYGHTERPDGRVYAVDIVGGRRLWDTDVGPAAAPPSLVHGLLIVLTRRGQIFALDPNTGHIKWRRTLGVARAPAIPSGDANLFVSTIDSLFVLSASNGQVLQRRKSPGAVLSGWAQHPRYQIAGTTDSLIIGFPIDSLVRAWSVRLDAPVIGTPMVRGDTAYALTRIGTLYRIPLSASPVAERLIGLNVAFIASAVLVQNFIVAGSADGGVYGFRLDGTIVWHIRIPGPIELTPLALPDGFLAISGRGDLHRYRL